MAFTISDFYKPIDLNSVRAIGIRSIKRVFLEFSELLE